MSALPSSAAVRRPSGSAEPSRPRRRHLHPVPRPRQRLARVPFLLVLAATLGLGMVGVLVLNTTVQTKAVQVRALEQQLTTLSYTEAELQTQLDRAGSPADLAERASDLGMRPNPYPAFIDVETGEVSGDPREVTGEEMSSLVTESEQKKAADAEREQAEREQAEREQEQAEQEQAEQEQAEQAEQEQAEQEQAEQEQAEQEQAEQEQAEQEQAEQEQAEQEQAEQEGTEDGDE